MAEPFGADVGAGVANELTLGDGRRLICATFLADANGAYQTTLRRRLDAVLLQFGLSTTGGPTSVTLRIYDQFGGLLVNESITVTSNVGATLAMGEDIGAQRRAPLRTMGVHVLRLEGTNLTGGHWELFVAPGS